MRLYRVRVWNRNSKIIINILDIMSFQLITYEIATVVEFCGPYYSFDYYNHSLLSLSILLLTLLWFVFISSNRILLADLQTTISLTKEVYRSINQSGTLVDRHGVFLTEKLLCPICTYIIYGTSRH